MNIAILYRKPQDLDKGYSADSQGRDGSAHILRVKEALSALGHLAQLHDVNLDSFEQLRRADFDLAFNLCDDGFRNDSLLEAHIPAMLDILGIPYTGSTVLALATCVDKARTKEILSFHNIPTPEFQIFSNSKEKLNKNLRFPLIVKPLHEDASIGLRKKSVVNNTAQLKRRVASVLKNYKQPALVEKFIKGREVYVGILGQQENLTVLPISEVVFADELAANAKICSYEAKWIRNSREYRNSPVECPAKLEAALQEKLIEIAKKAYCLLQCQDYGRIDFRIDNSNQPYVLEVNPNPDISEDAGLSKMARASGMTYDELIERILSSALQRTCPQQLAVVR